MSTSSSTVLRNVHQREVPASAEEVWALVERLGTAADCLWPSDRWPALRLDRGVAIGSKGGHGPIRYHVAEVEEGTWVRFAFDPAGGFVGGHEFRLESTDHGTRLAHELEVHAPGIVLTGLILPLHDALLEDLLDDLEANIRRVPSRRRRLPVGVCVRRTVIDVVEALSAPFAGRSVTAAG
ncbi:SRPBCC family protein [Brevibacterium metallidurans]|uniref:SRPBCC family protein n=1 Tax=Brevibacterium metallidurans TaxID=1482676 RepID=A0ABP3CAW0_9MICO